MPASVGEYWRVLALSGNLQGISDELMKSVYPVSLGFSLLQASRIQVLVNKGRRRVEGGNTGEFVSSLKVETQRRFIFA